MVSVIQICGGRRGALGSYSGAAVVVLTLLVSSPGHADQDTTDIATIVAKLHDWRRSFATIRVNWRTGNRDLFIQNHPDLPPEQEWEGGYVSKYELIWSDSGAFRFEFVSERAGNRTFREAQGSDGRLRWTPLSRPKNIFS